MKPPIFFVLIAALTFLTGCGSLDNPVARLFHTGHDARVYNAQTGQFEWPEETKKPRSSRKAADVASALAATPAPQGRNDGRYFDAQKNEWIESKPESAAAPSRGPKPTPRPAAAAALPTPSSPASPPPPARDTGYYNSSTGKIEWGAAHVAPAPTSAPTKARHWWWPF